MEDAYRRTCSHFSTRSTVGIPEGTVLRTVLTGNVHGVGIDIRLSNQRLDMSHVCLLYITRPSPNTII